MAQSQQLRALTFCVALGMPCAADSQELAPSCDRVFSTYHYSGKIEDQTLLVLIDNKLHDAFEAQTPPRTRAYQFYYVYQNQDCAALNGCVQTPIVTIKTTKVVKIRPPPSVFLSREGDPSDMDVGKAEYDEFHNANATIPQGALNRFHVSYDGPSGTRLHTHSPKERRRLYLFDLQAGQYAWLKARNYRFTINPGTAQCIPFDVEVQRGIESAFVDILQMEDGSGRITQKIQRWDLKLK